MKKLAAILTLALSLVPVSASAGGNDQFIYDGNPHLYGGATSFTGVVTGVATTLPVRSLDNAFNTFEFANPPSAAEPTSPFSLVALVDADLVNQNIAGLKVACLPYVDAYTSILGYLYAHIDGSYPLDGMNGGTITVAEYKSSGVVTVIGTVSIPSVAFPGPYVSSASVVLTTPYVPSSGSIISAYVSSSSSVHGQGYKECQLSLSYS